MDKNFVYTCVECRLSDTINKDTAQCKQGKFSDQLIVNKTQTALEVESYQYHKIDFCDIKNALYFWYHKIDYLISLIRFIDITK